MLGGSLVNEKRNLSEPGKLVKFSSQRELCLRSVLYAMIAAIGEEYCIVLMEIS